MVKRLLLALMLLSGIMRVQAQNDNAIALVVGSRSVTRGELAAVCRHTALASKGTQKLTDDFLEAYVNYLLKVEAARAVRMDTTQTFRMMVMALPRQSSEEDAQPTTDDALVAMHRADVGRILQCESGASSTAEMVQLAHIFVKVHQRGQRNELQRAIRRIDSAYSALERGANFEMLARQVSDDRPSAQQGGVMGWYGRNQLLKELEQAAFSLEKGKYSRPVLADDGYHIVKVVDRKRVGDFEHLSAWKNDAAYRDAVMKGVRSSASVAPNDAKDHGLLMTNGASDAKSSPCDERRPSGVDAQTVDARAAMETALNDRVAQLQIEQRDVYEGLLLCALSKHSLVRRAANDESAMARYFKKHKKQYRRKGFKPKNYLEVKDLVAADLYAEMEKHWVADLKEQYPVVIHKDVVKSINK